MNKLVGNIVKFHVVSYYCFSEVIAQTPKSDHISRIDAAIRKRPQFRRVILYESKPFDMGIEGTDIDNGDDHKRQKVRDEPVDPRADVHMRRRSAAVNLPRCPQILMEIVPARASRGVLVVADDREELSDTNGQAPIDCQTFIFPQIAQVSRDVAQRFDENRIDAQRLRDISVDYSLHWAAGTEGAAAMPGR